MTCTHSIEYFPMTSDRVGWIGMRQIYQLTVSHTSGIIILYLASVHLHIACKNSRLQSIKFMLCAQEEVDTAYSGDQYGQQQYG